MNPATLGTKGIARGKANHANIPKVAPYRHCGGGGASCASSAVVPSGTAGGAGAETGSEGGVGLDGPAAPVNSVVARVASSASVTATLSAGK